jgi:hypothetical protein
VVVIVDVSSDNGGGDDDDVKVKWSHYTPWRRLLREEV